MYLKLHKNLPLKFENNAHKNILSIFSDTIHEFDSEFIHKVLGADEGLISPLGIGRGNGKGQGKGKGLGKEEKKPKVSKTEIEIIYPFNSDGFIEIWDAWKQYRKEIGKPIKSALSEQQALLDLQKYGEDIAIKMIRQSIANSWQGIFPIKTDNTNGKQSFKDQQSELDRIGNEARERLAKHYIGNPDLRQ